MLDNRIKLAIEWSEIEESAKEQITAITHVPGFVSGAIMPDCHASKSSLPVGGVCVLNGYVSPAMVGVDIACGMTSINTHVKYSSEKYTHAYRENIFDNIHKLVPVGFNRRTEVVPESEEWIDVYQNSIPNAIRNQINELVKCQMGTLGSGNHFLEIGINSNNEICITVHSGSRRVGFDVAEYFTSTFGEYLHANSNEACDYWSAYNACAVFAIMSRRVMLQKALEALEIDYFSLIAEKLHNTVEEIGENMFLHRKGAISATKGEIDIIPANQRDGVFVVEGLGNTEYLCSASHGCGRKMSRGQARKIYNEEEFKSMMGDIVCWTNSSVADESPVAYKNWHFVFENLVSRKMVKIIDRIKPVICVKG